MISSEQLQRRLFKSSEHPYRKYESKIASILKSYHIMLDAGCGRSAPILRKYTNRASVLIGLDLELPVIKDKNIYYVKGDISAIPIENDSLDIVISKAVLEHVPNPGQVFEEIHRVLKSGGSFIFLIPNLGDYVSLLSKLIPNKFHKQIVSKMEGRKPSDVFPTYYKANTQSAVKHLSHRNGFIIKKLELVGQYPSMLMFNVFLFAIAALYEKIISRFEAFKALRGWILVEAVKK